MFGKLEGAHWISAVKISKKRETEIDSCFEPKVEFYYPESEYETKKDFWGLRESLQRKTREKSVVPGTKGSGEGEYIERDNLIVLDDVINVLSQVWLQCVVYISRTRPQ